MRDTLSESVGNPTFTVAYLNMFLDRTHGESVQSQDQRIESIAKTIVNLEVSPDILGIIEAEQTDQQHNGRELARLTGNPEGRWAQHSRRGEYIGMFGAAVREVDFIDLGHDKKAAITRVGKIAMATTHLKREKKWFGPIRGEQATRLMGEIGDEEQAVLMLDRNGLPWQEAGRIIESYGYVSAFDLAFGRHPKTVPTPRYRSIVTKPWERLLIGGGLAVDDIYVKGLDVLNAGTFHADSDHLGLWATVRAQS